MKKEEKLKMLAGDLKPEFREPLKKLLVEDQIIDEKEFARLTALLVDAFDETLADTPNEKRMERKLRALVMGLLDLKYEGEIEDELLRQATKFIREKIVRKGEKEKLARLLAKEIIKNWLAMDEDLIDHIAGFDGLLERLQDKAEGDLDFEDDELLDIMLETGEILIINYMQNMSDKEVDSLIEQSKHVCTLIENEAELEDDLLNLAQFAMQHLGFIAMMRRAFAGLLLSDLIIRQIGKGLGLKEKISVTDFIIFISVKVFEKEELKDIEKDRVIKIKEILEKTG